MKIEWENGDVLYEGNYIVTVLRPSTRETFVSTDYYEFCDGWQNYGEGTPYKVIAFYPIAEIIPYEDNKSKIMTRKEQINLYLKERNIPITSLEANSIIEGAQWADEHPNPNTIKKIFKFALEKTNFLIADNLESIDWEVLIKKAMEE